MTAGDTINRALWVGASPTAFTNPKDNTMAKIINAAGSKHKAQMKILADAFDLYSITYQDLGNKEIYALETKDGKKVNLHACGNKFDGGFLCIEKV